MLQFFRHSKYDNCQTLLDGDTYWVLPIHTTFSELDCISRSQQYQTVFNWKCYVLMQLKWNSVWLLITSSRSWIYGYFGFLHIFKGDDLTFFPCLKKNVTLLLFFSHTGKTKFFKISMVITLLRVYIFIVDLMTLILFQSLGYVRNINCKLCFLESCLDYCLL